MVFSSLEFLLMFFPIIVLVNFLLPKCMRNYWLLIGSLFFYAWGEPKFVLVMLLSILINWVTAICIEKYKKLKIFYLGVAVCLNLSILFIYKYLDFVLENLVSVFPGMGVTKLEIPLPIGISFFTFQALSYVVDVYRGIPAQKNIFYLALYISFFPQLIAGPIVRYTAVADQIENRTCNIYKFSTGFMRFILGLNKKIILSNLLAEVADYAFSVNQLSVGMAWLGAICYTLQIFFDFSGYSDMAIGLGEIFGFYFPENFNYPYISKSLTEFWRRWHISLGSWFRDYVYFPLGGSRVSSRFRLIFNLSVVWLLTGIWHGASWHFIVWGILHGIIVILEKLLKIPTRIEGKKIRFFYQGFVCLFVCWGWVIFRSNNMAQAMNYLQTMCGLKGSQLIDANFRFYLKSYIVIILVSIVCSTPVLSIIKNKLNNNYIGKHIFNIAFNLAQVFLFAVSISFLVINAHNLFIYFNF